MPSLEEEEILRIDSRATRTWVPATLDRYYKVPDRARRRFTRQKHIRLPVVNGYFDPMSHMFVIDTLMKLENPTGFRARALTALLSQLHPHILWDNYTVGRILGELVELSYDRWPQTIHTAIYSKRDQQGNRYTLSVTAESWHWLKSLREWCGHMSDEVVREITTTRNMPPRQSSVYVGMPDPGNVEDETYDTLELPPATDAGIVTIIP